MDGVGVNPSKIDNAVALANTPCLDELYSKYPTTLIEASGLPVGLPAGQMGNSEVGHLTIGCGSRLRQDLVKINDAINDGSFADNAAFSAALDYAEKNSGCVHLLGLVSDGGVHSHTRHLAELIRLCYKRNVKALVHAITDGRDTAPMSSSGFFSELQPLLDETGAEIATVCGRYYALDRDNRWDRVERAWKLLVDGEGERADSAVEAVERAWKNDQTDEFIEPVVLPGYRKPVANDAWIFFNFRNDRPRELTLALADKTFDAFDRGDFSPVTLTTMTRYHAGYSYPVAFDKEVPDVTLGQVISDAGLRQFRAAETEKYPHVTFFFNGGQEEPLDGEERLLVESPKVATYDLQPEMSAFGIRDGLLQAMDDGGHSLYVVNFANGDMVGHTGIADAVVKAVETVDTCVGELVVKARQNAITVIVTADHGNADMLVDPATGGPHTKHTTFPVALTVIDDRQLTLTNAGDLTSIAPTILDLMNIPKPASMTGSSLLLPDA